MLDQTVILLWLGLRVSSGPARLGPYRGRWVSLAQRPPRPRTGQARKPPGPWACSRAGPFSTADSGPFSTADSARHRTFLGAASLHRAPSKRALRGTLPRPPLRGSTITPTRPSEDPQLPHQIHVRICCCPPGSCEILLLPHQLPERIHCCPTKSL